MGRKLIILIVIIIVLILIGIFVEGFRQDARYIYDPPGDFVEYEQTNLHYIKKGSGDQTVVFDSGSGTVSPYADMYHLQKEISDKAETIVYERPGYGWSDSTDRPRSTDELTREMEMVLDEASDNDSFIFVGHSMAALEIFSYAQQNPEKVDGIVLIDGVQPEYASRMDQSIPISIHLTRFLKKTGILRLLSNFEFYERQLFQNENVPDDVKDIGVGFAMDRTWNKTMLDERKAIPGNGNVVEKGDLGDIPLVTFSASNNPMEGWEASQEKLPGMSSDTEQIWIDTDNHFIHHEEPDQIVEKIKMLLEQDR